jgi:uncharacterized protein
LEELDGFFAAFCCSPEVLSVHDFLSDIWGDETGEEDMPFDSIEELNQFLNLLMRYKREVGKRFKEEIFFPKLLLDEKKAQVKGNKWAQGFLRGGQISDSLEEIMNNEEVSGCLVAILALAYEHHEDVELRPYEEEVTPEQREKLLISLCVGVTGIYRYFFPHRKAYAKMAKEKNTLKNQKRRLGRNDPCYCGSGIKYKRCCLQ